MCVDCGVLVRYEALRQINPNHHTFCQKDVAIIHKYVEGGGGRVPVCFQTRCTDDDWDGRMCARVPSAGLVLNGSHMLETQFNTFIMDAVLPRSMKEDYAKRFGRDEVSAAYLHQQAVDMLPDIDYTVKLNDKQLELVRWADIIGSLSQVQAATRNAMASR